MLVLGIETSCDETAAAVVRDGKHILSNVVSSSLGEHKKYYGIIPEIASRAHVEVISYVVKEAIKKAKVKLDDIDCLAVTVNPGLVGSLLVGISFAKALSFSLKKPLIEVNHLEAHLYAAFLENQVPKIPFIGLVVSGGHSSIFYIPKMGDFRLLGSTQDDAAGEAFDKVARILGLGYPGGPIIDRLAKRGNARKLRFNCAQLPDTFDFSFSGIKTSVLYYVRDKWDKKYVTISDIAAAFQEEVVNILVKKSLIACKAKGVKTLVVGGGVACNSRLRYKLNYEAKDKGVKVYFPPADLCLDNAAMVAGLGYQLHSC